MRRIRTAISVILLTLAGMVFAGGNALLPSFMPGEEDSRSRPAPKRTVKKDRKYVDLKSSAGRQTEYGGRKILIATENFAAHHNGAVITCDSAVRFSESRLECFGHVLINKGTTYIYGDRADYNGETNLAHIYSDIVKVVDKDATLYTLNFTFNTKTSVGQFTGGGYAVRGDDVLESQRGYYNTDTKELTCVDDVRMKNDTYQLAGDSVIYNLETNHALFFENTNIWNTKENDYLYADRGTFDKNEDRYTVTKNGYLLTEHEEAWSDSMDYRRQTGYVLLRSNLQLDNQKDKIMAFGHWGEYWKERGDAFLTRNPAVLSYDTSEGDSLYMRADSMYLFTRNPEMDRADSLARLGITDQPKDQPAASKPALAAGEENGDDAGEAPVRPKTKEEIMKEKASHTGNAVKKSLGLSSAPEKPTETAPEEKTGADSLSKDSLKVDSIKSPLDTMDAKQKKAYLKELKKKDKEAQAKIKADSLRKKLDAIAERRQAKKTAFLKRMERQDSIRNAKAEARADLRLKKRVAKLERKGVKIMAADSMTLLRADSVLQAHYIHYDTLANHVLDSLILLYFPKEAADSTMVQALVTDSTYRLVKAFRRVKIFRSDFQAVCDSLAASSVDSIIRMYKEPVLWNDNNQITSEVINAITEKQRIVRADFEGKPMTVAEIDTAHYNQVTGKEMKAYFRDNQIYRNDVNGNVQTIYYVQEGDDQEITMMAYMESADMSSYIENRKIVGITYRGNPTYTFYPIDKIPEKQPQRLKGFKWEADRRPTVDSVFKYVIRPTLRDEKESMNLPEFRISERIDKRRKRMTTIKEWEDRTDTLSIETLEWLSSLR